MYEYYLNRLDTYYTEIDSLESKLSSDLTEVETAGQLVLDASRLLHWCESPQYNVAGDSIIELFNVALLPSLNYAGDIAIKAILGELYAELSKCNADASHNKDRNLTLGIRKVKTSIEIIEHITDANFLSNLASLKTSLKRFTSELSSLIIRLSRNSNPEHAAFLRKAHATYHAAQLVGNTPFMAMSEDLNLIDSVDSLGVCLNLLTSHSFE